MKINEVGPGLINPTPGQSLSITLKEKTDASRTLNPETIFVITQTHSCGTLR